MHTISRSPKFLEKLETEIEAINPGASAVLVGNDIDVGELAWKLSSTLPNIISIGFNPSASRNVLAGSVTDVIEAIQKAKPITVPPRAEWNRRRSLVHEATMSKLPVEPAPATATAKADATEETVARAAAHGGGGGGNGGGGGYRGGSSGGRRSKLSLATIPPEVPELPAALQARPTLHEEMKKRVLAVTSGWSQQAARVERWRRRAWVVSVRPQRFRAYTRRWLRSAFERLLWVSISRARSPSAAEGPPLSADVK